MKGLGLTRQKGLIGMLLGVLCYGNYPPVKYPPVVGFNFRVQAQLRQSEGLREGA